MIRIRTRDKEVMIAIRIYLCFCMKIKFTMHIRTRMYLSYVFDEFFFWSLPLLSPPPLSRSSAHTPIHTHTHPYINTHTTRTYISYIQHTYARQRNTYARQRNTYATTFKSPQFAAINVSKFNQHREVFVKGSICLN